MAPITHPGAAAAPWAPVDPVALTRRLVDIDSTTGREGEVAGVLAALLRERGYSVLETRRRRNR